MAFILVITVSSAQAGGFTLLGGLNRNADTGDGTYSWQVDYTKQLNSYLAVSLAYINEGHVPAHHRDGHAVSLWAYTDVVDRRLKLAAGVGTYFYYDTTVAQAGGDYSNSHGLGTVFSLAATWKTDSPWHYQIRSNVIKGFNSIDTVSVLAGIGYDLEEKEKRAAGGKSADTVREIGRDELTFLGGQTIVNSFKSEKAIAVSLEYRRTLMRYLDGTLAWIYEGDNRLLRRNGFATQLWLADNFMDGTVALGMGVGAYFSVDHYPRVGSYKNWSYKTISAIVTLTTAYHIHPDWSLRASWHRIVTDYDRDTDIILGGIGYHY
jgi:hypothetical protein